MVVLIDSGLGPRIVGEVANYMRDATAWPASNLRSITPLMQADQVFKDLYADGSTWNAAVGLGFGCGPAAALLRAGRAQRALLVDPAAMLSLDSGLALVSTASTSLPTKVETNYSWLVDQHEPGDFNDPPELVLKDIDEALKFSKLNAPPFDAVKILHQPPSMNVSLTGPYPRKVYAAYVAHIYGKRVTNNLSLWERVTSIWQAAAEAREPYDQDLPFEPDLVSKECLNWMSAWIDPRLDITIWLSTSYHSLATPLARRGPSRPLVKQPWDPLIWITNPRQLAGYLTDWLR